ncbi:MAG: alkaline phosphatase family protein [Propionibacteriaceae bacterium]|nr:alkaline phosphatase family protein [Propionibacteriaceae bacterium]
MKIPESGRYVLVLVDGLGWEILVRACIEAPYLSEILGDALTLEVGTPSTTCASLMSLWTGVSTGTHGVLGFSFETGLKSDRSRGVTTPLSITKPLDTAPSYLDRLMDAGVCVSSVIPTEHVDSGLTRMSTTKASVIGIDLERQDSRISSIVAASRCGEKSVVYVYEPRLDHAGHGHGVASKTWIQALRDIDDFLENLRSSLDDDVCLLITGDHGMIDIARENRIYIDSQSTLTQDLRLVGGEARFRHLYTHQPLAVQTRWTRYLGDEAQVLTREEAVSLGLFGEVRPEYLSRIGDVVVIPTGGQAYLCNKFPGEFSLVGFHGGLTSVEKMVPLLID